MCRHSACSLRRSPWLALSSAVSTHVRCRDGVYCSARRVYGRRRIGGILKDHGHEAVLKEREPSQREPLRLLIATDSLANAGAERQLALTAMNLPDRWQVRCFSVGDGPYAAGLREHGIEVQVVERRWRYDPLPFLRLWALVAWWRPHLVHSWGYMTTLAGFPIFRALRIPFVDGSIRIGDVRLAGKLRRRAGFDRAALVAANSQAGLDSAGVGPERGRIIRNGLDLTRIPETLPTRKDDRFSVVMAARMTRHKDYGALIAAARAMLAALGPSAIRFVLLGEGPERQRLESENRDLVDAGALEFGYVPDVVPRLLVSDCGVLMTSERELAEGLSNAILEYMACGLPVICSRGGGTEELVRDGETGFVVASGDSEALADRLKWVYLNREAAKAMGRKGAETARRDYSVEAMIRATDDVYEEALALGGRSLRRRP
jgi:glycosyltransferase involved in cell wall biosynthesis